LIYASIAYPIYVDERDEFETIEGIVYVLSHECDVAVENPKAFNDDILICPLIPFDATAEAYQKRYGEKELRTWLSNLAKGKLYRLVYFSKVEQHLKYDAVMFLNQMSGTKVRMFTKAGAERVAALGEVGLWQLEVVLRNHFLRPKAEMWGSPPLH
jgi:hypothetical protein